MARIKVGARFMTPQGEAAPGEEATAAVQVQWVELNGRRLDTEELNIISVEHQADYGAHMAKLAFAVTTYEVVDHRQPAPDVEDPEEWSLDQAYNVLAANVGPGRWDGPFEGSCVIPAGYKAAVLRALDTIYRAAMAADSAVTMISPTDAGVDETS